MLKFNNLKKLSFDEIDNLLDYLTDGEEVLEEVILKRKSITYQNGELAVWLTDKKENLEDIQKNTAPEKAIIIKRKLYRHLC